MASAHDRAVLQAFFNPTSPFGDIPGLNQEDQLTDDDSVFDPELVKRVKDLELQEVSAAESGDLPARAISLSGGIGRSACQALVQRGLLLRLSGRDEEARVDFEKAAALGSEFARQQAVILNPYTALCNRMLSEVINKLRNPEMSDMP
uniref:Tetratricopeptide repeat protein 36 n=1 Tax=Sinocyclocheilus anshuiensis TaxID=1608454 RepID=A0A671MAW0_9TELE